MLIKNCNWKRFSANLIDLNAAQNNLDSRIMDKKYTTKENLNIN